MAYEDRLEQLLAEEARMSHSYSVIVLKPRFVGESDIDFILQEALV